MALSKDEMTKVREAADLIKRELASGEELVVYKFGSFSVKQTAARKGRKPGTDQVIDIPAKTGVRFKAYKALTESL